MPAPPPQFRRSKKPYACWTISSTFGLIEINARLLVQSDISIGFYRGVGDAVMNALETMTKDVITVGPDTTEAEIAAMLVRHRISAVPVISADDRVSGIVSQSDLGETVTEKKRKWWLQLFPGADSRAREYVKSHGLRADTARRLGREYRQP